MTEPLSAHESGLRASTTTPLIIFLGGFPDDHGTWAEVAPKFQSTHTVVTVCMPDFDQPRLSKGHHWGYSFEDIVARLVAVLEPRKAQSESLTLVCHDWGSIIGQLVTSTRPELVDKVVFMDVGIYKLKLGGGMFWNTMLIMLYQSWLAWAFVVASITFVPLLGDLMLLMFPWKWLGPCPNEPKMPKRLTPGPSVVHMCYPYLRTFVAIVGNKDSILKKIAFPTMPLLYIYGTDKRCVFHNQSFLDRIEATEECYVKAFDCGHFIQTQRPDELVAEISAFVQK